MESARLNRKKAHVLGLTDDLGLGLLDDEFGRLVDNSRRRRLIDCRHFYDCCRRRLHPTPAQQITGPHCIIIIIIIKDIYIAQAPSMLWRCWLGGRKGIRPVKNLSGGVLARLSVWSEVQTCMWPSWCHCHSLSLASVKSRLVLPFYYRLTRVVPEKGR